jgi:hypothetical protein
MIDKIDLDIKQALKNGDQATATALRFLKSVIINARIAAGHELVDDEIVRVIRKEIKSRIEARDIYSRNGRQELAAKEETERQLYSSYVPADLKPAELDRLVTAAAKKLNQDLTFSHLMPATMKLVAGQADGQTVAQAVNRYIERPKL